MNIHSEISDIKLLDCFWAGDERGKFIKTYNFSEFALSEIGMEIKEIYYSESCKDTIRGMHFQIPPMDHEKLVHVISGSVTDVIVDLRKNSKTYGKVFSFLLSAGTPQALYIPKGFAHGFKCLENDTKMLYMVSSIYSREHDMGIAYDSIDFDWGIDAPIVSDRDKTFIKLEEFNSPF